MPRHGKQAPTKVVILAGGVGSRLQEETSTRPKPMVEIGGMPILWHIMKIYARHDIADFVCCLGYKGYVVKEFFASYFLHMSDVVFDFRDGGRTTYLNRVADPWRVTLVDTGSKTQTGGRIKRVQEHLRPGEPFMLTYGDGVADIDVSALIDFHRSHDCLVTVTGVRPPGKYGVLSATEDGRVRRFSEKPVEGSGWINGGFFVCEYEIFDYIREGDATIWEFEPLEKLAAEGQLAVYHHHGFWRCMDTLRDRNDLDAMCAGQTAPPWLSGVQ